MASLTTAKTIVIKIGSALLVDGGSGRLRAAWVRGLAEDVAMLRARGARVVLVSSGAIALGRHALDLPSGALSLERSQASAAVGQIRLARAYEEALAPHGVTTAQVLVTLEDSADRRRYLNSRATLAQLLGLGCVPIVNENDTVATDEIRFGDNDRLAAQVAVTVGADVLILLSDVDGFYTADPRTDAGARRLDRIDEITPEIEAMAGDAGSGLSKGGMKTKVQAAKTAVGQGCAMVIAAGAPLRPVQAIEQGAPVSWFTARITPRAARKRWIAGMKPQGTVTVDAGAMGALGQGKSLLPAGVTAAEGAFGRGDPVAILTPDGRTLGQGLARYPAAEARLILGCRSDGIEARLGYPARAALIHRDDMAL